MLWLARCAALILGLGLSFGSVAAQDGPPPEGPENAASREGEAPKPARKPRGPVSQARMPVRIVAGRLVVRCEISTRFRRIPVNLFVDYDRPVGLELHNQAAAGIRLDDRGGVPITVHLPGFDLTVDRREHGDEDYLNEFTKLYSKELGETSCVGSIGANILAGYHVIFDLQANFVYLEPARERSTDPPEDVTGTFVTAVDLTNDLVWIPVRRPDGKVTSISLSTTRYDTVIDRDYCEDVGKPAGDVGTIELKTTDLSKYVAFRPVELVQVHPDGAFGAIGLNLLEHFRIEIDRVNGYARFTPTAPAAYPAEDLEFFQAMVEEEPEPLLAVLDKHPDARLAREAAEMLVDLLIEIGGEPTAFQSALEWMDKTRIEDLRATEALATMKTLLEAQRPDVAIMAGKIGVKSGRDDRYPESVHKLHAKLGELLLGEKRGRDAWEHLLSAAFGLPDDGMINLHLGQFYEDEKRFKRAMSRYIQSVIQPESGALAVKALERLQKKMSGEALSVDEVDKRVQGKVYNFGAATKFKPDEKHDTNRVVLAELVTNPHFGRPLTEGWVSFAVGGAMGIEGLLSHFPRDRLAVLSYHTDQPEPNALQNDLGMEMFDLYRDNRPLYTKINGVTTGPGAQRWRRAEEVYETNRQLVLEEMAKPSRHDIDIEARVENGKVVGKVIVSGPPELNANLSVILVERGVLYPGKAKIVVHRMLARAALTEDLLGEAFIADGEEGNSMTYEFSKLLEEVTTENVRHLDNYEKDGGGAATRLSVNIDPRQVSIVAYLRDMTTLEVLQAGYVDAKLIEADAKSDKTSDTTPENDR